MACSVSARWTRFRLAGTRPGKSARTTEGAPGREAGGAFGFGGTLRGVPPADHRLTLLGKPGCHLCEEAREVLARVAADLGVPWEEADVTGDARLYAEYGDRIPVVLLDGKEHGYWTVDEARLRRDLAR